ncbi:MAG: transcriptional regulator [Candidatus Thiodiazotropha sp.]
MKLSLLMIRQVALCFLISGKGGSWSSTGCLGSVLMAFSGNIETASTGYANKGCIDLSRSPRDWLVKRRAAVDEQWLRFRNGLPVLDLQGVRKDILSSWRRSVEGVESSQPHAPGSDRAHAEHYWQDSPIGRAAARSLDDLMRMAEEGDLVAAIADPNGRLIWTYAAEGRRLQAESINLKVGSYWHEQAIGTHSIGLALNQGRPVTVISSEHFQPFIHDWVSYAAPIYYPKTDRCAGVLCLSTVWKQHTPLGQAAVAELARTISTDLTTEHAKAELEIYALGQPKVVFRGKVLQLPFRQIEILCLLALNSRGLSLESFHAALYGDAQIAFSTLKAELSHLRRLLGGKIGSRPYRLQLSVWGDFIEIWQALRRKQNGEAFSLYRGSLLTDSVSPELEEWRHCIDAVMSQALGNCQDPLILMDKLCGNTSGSELVRERLFEMMSPVRAQCD